MEKTRGAQQHRFHRHRSRLRLDGAVQRFLLLRIVAVCDVYEKRKRIAAEKFKAQGYTDYREVLALPEVDAVIVATPDHWHGKIANRKYQDRPRILKRNHYDPLVDVSYDSQGVLQLTGQKPRLRDDLRAYFSDRNEDSIDL